MGTGPDVNDRWTRPFLIIVVFAMAAAAAAFLIQPPEIGSVITPPDVHSLATRVASHPMDWAATSALAEVSLDSNRPDRVALWRAAYEHASRLAPERHDPATGFARAAFLHWGELSESDRREALEAYAPLLRNTETFRRMAKPLFELTGDLAYLHRAGPPTAETLGGLINLALPNGRFADYRALRQELQRKRIADFAGQRGVAAPEELVAQFPMPPYRTDAEPLILGLLEELHHRPLDDDPHRADVVEGIVDYALRHDIRPLDGLEVITRRPGSVSVATRIKLAQALGLNERASQLAMASNDPRRVLPNESDWQGLCEKDICTRAWRMIEAEHGIGLTVETVHTDEVPAYVEIYVDDALRAEGEAGPRRDFVVPVGTPGRHRIEVVLANPMTRNLSQRSVRVASITTL
jgi:hypothetical protein